MPSFSKRSLEQLETCHPDLQRLCHEVIKHFDFVVLCGHRNEADQNEAFRTGKSKTPWPTSKHNSMPSMAVDVIPYPVDWLDTKRMYFLAGHFRMAALTLGIPIRQGLDWNGDTQLKDNKFNDIPHIELVK